MDTESLKAPLAPRMEWRVTRPRRGYVRVLLFTTCLFALFLWNIHRKDDQDHGWSKDSNFQELSLTGFANIGKAGQVACDDIGHEGNIGVQQSFFLDDDIQAIAASLKDHPMIVYDGQDSKLTHEEIVAKTWLRLASSSVWLEQFQVYLTVTRVLFYDKGVRAWPVISFLRGQIHNADWKELHNYTIEWQGEKMTFPRMFDIPTAFNKGGGFYGPEDPRIIIETGNFDGISMPEPVIIFNMLVDDDRKRRAMWVFRPFSNDTQILNIVGKKPNNSEKNWMPFFLADESKGLSKKWPSHYIHFVYDWKPFRILKCHLLNGWCEFVYIQPEVSDELKSEHNDTSGVMRGGSNFFPIFPATTVATGVQHFVGFPRTHMDKGCTDAFYRPALMLLTATSAGQFHISYLSTAMDFNGAAMSEEAHQDPCGAGRILIANSIARWERDTMTISFTVDDDTTQVLRLRGLTSYLRGLMELGIGEGGSDELELQRSAVGQDVLLCSVEAAASYMLTRTELVHGVDLRKQREEESRNEHGE